MSERSPGIFGEQGTILSRMSAPTMRKLRHVLFVSAMTALLPACTGQVQAAPARASSCEELSKKRALDESCAIEIAKKEVASREGGRQYVKFKARFDEKDKLWVVEAIRELNVPGAYVVVAVTTDGQVKDYSHGL
jgi:hypothetical protein